MIPVELYYKKDLIATLSDSAIEWPRSDSVYKLVENVDPFIIDYIKYSIEYSNIVNSTDNDELETFVKNEESKYMELIESNDWSIVDSKGLTHPILIPIFHPDNIVVWMLNL